MKVVKSLRLLPLDDLLNLLNGLVLQHFLQHLLYLHCTYGSVQTQNLHCSSLLYELAFDPQSLLCHFLPTVVADLLVPSLLSPFLEVTLNFESANGFYLLFLVDQQQPPHVLEGNLLLLK